MSMFRRHPARDHLSDYWNALNRGAPPDELARLAQALDPTVIAAIDRARALHRRRRPDPAFATRLEHTLMDVFATAPTGSIPLSPTRPGPTNGRFHLRPRIPSIVGPATSRRRWAVAQFALAALLIVTLLGVYLLFKHADQRAVQPPASPVATPAATLGDDVSMYRGNAARTGEMPGPGPETQPEIRWTFQTQGEVHSAPALVAGVLYVGSNDNNLYALDTANGAEIWRFETGGPVSSSPAVVDGVVYVGSADENVYAIDALTGTERWHVEGARDNASPAVVDGVVFTGTVDGAFMALDAENGQEIWQVTLSGAVSRSAAVADGLVYIGTNDGLLHALDATNGEERWTFPTGLTSVLTPAVADGTVFFVGRGDDGQGTLYAADAATGAERWRFTTPSGAAGGPLAIGVGFVFTGGHDGNVYAINAASGQERWTYTTGDQNRFDAAPALADGALYAAGVDGALAAIDAVTGRERWHLTLDGPMDYGPTVSGGIVYVGTHVGTVHALGAEEVAAEPTNVRGEIAAPDLPASPQPGTGSASPVPEQAGSPVAIQTGPVEFVAEITGGSDPLRGPSGVAIDAEGNLYVVDALNDRIRIFDPNGAPIATWGESGTGPGQFRFHREQAWHGDIAIDQQGNVYVSDIFNDRIQKFDQDGTFLLAWGTAGSGNDQFGELAGLTVDAEGRVYVADYGNHRVQVFDGDGQFLAVWDDIGGEGNLRAGPNDVAVDAAGIVYVTDDANDQVHRFDATGAYLGSIGEPGTDPGQFSFPWGIALDARGNVYVADYDSHRVQGFAPDGTLIEAWGEPGAEVGQFSNPIYLSFDPAGYLFVADEGNNRVQKFRLLPPLAPEATPTA